MILSILHDRTGRLEKAMMMPLQMIALHDRTGRLEIFTLHINS